MSDFLIKRVINYFTVFVNLITIIVNRILKFKWYFFIIFSKFYANPPRCSPACDRRPLSSQYHRLLSSTQAHCQPKVARLQCIQCNPYIRLWSSCLNIESSNAMLAKPSNMILNALLCKQLLACWPAQMDQRASFCAGLRGRSLRLWHLLSWSMTPCGGPRPRP